MTKKALYRRLNRVEDLDGRLKVVCMKIERLESCLQGHAIRYDVDKVQTSPQDPVADIMASLDKLLDQKKRLQAEIARAVDDVADLIDLLLPEKQDNNQWLVMHYRYIAGYKWRVIASIIGVSERHVYRLHDEAIDWLAKKV